MQIIKKTINLEPFKTRFSGMKIPACDDSVVREVKWGEIPKDIVVNNILVRYEKTFPLVRDSLGKTLILRFRRAIEIFSFLKSFINDSKFYALCKRGNELRWVMCDDDMLTDEESISNIKGIFNFLPNTEGFAIGDIIWVGEGADDFLKIFQLEGDTLYIAVIYARLFVAYITNAFYNEYLEIDGVNFYHEQYNENGVKGKKDEISVCTKTSSYGVNPEPFIFNHFYIWDNGSWNDVGTVTPYLPIDILLAEDYDDMGLFSPAASEWIPNKKYYQGECVIYENEPYCLEEAPLVDEDGKHYYKGNFVEADKITYFDDIEYGKIVLNHWKKAGGGLSQTEKINGFAESRLRSLIRFKKDFDDDGNELPFILKKEGEEVAGADLLYVEGLKFNIKTVENITFCDYIDKIKENGRGEITFTYYIGATMDVDGRIDRGSGVKYEETYPCTRKMWSGYYDKKLITVEYTDIEYVNQIWDPSLEAEEGKIYARVTYPISGNEDFAEIPYIKRDSLMGIQNYTANIDNIRISRGKAAAFELHNILGEVQTFEDLETYRNDFFNVKSNEIR